jgi:hypothetical protein
MKKCSGSFRHITVLVVGATLRILEHDAPPKNKSEDVPW